MPESNPRRLRIVYMGTPDFAVPPLQALIASRDDVVGVITQPDRPRGRGKELQPTPVKAAAQRAGRPVFQPEDINSSRALEQLESWEPDVAVVAAYGQILAPPVLDLPEYGCFNIHASLLPRYRGAAPINWAIVRGEEESGVTIMKMDEGLDTGPMLLKKKTLIGPLDTAGALHDRLSEMGAELIIDVMRLIHLDSLTEIEQDDRAATYAPMLSKSDGAIDWTSSARKIANLIRGFNPWPGAHSFLHSDSDRERIKFHLAQARDHDDGSTFDDSEPGRVVVADRSEGRLLIATGEGLLECLKLQAPGRRAMDVGDFLNGHSISVGDRFEDK